MSKCEAHEVLLDAEPVDVTLEEAGYLRTHALESRLEREVQEAYERGRREGEQALGEQLIQQRNSLHELENGILKNLRQSVTETRSQCQQSLVELAVEAAARLVGDLPISAELVEAVLREALDQVEDSTDVTVQLNSHDLELLRSLESPMLAPAPEVRLEASAEVGRGGCVVLTRFGVIDCRRETKLKLLRAAILP